MHSLNIVGVFPGGVAGSAHEADNLSGADKVSLLQSRCIRRVLAQMGVVVIPFFVQRTDAHAPAAVLVPAQRLHRPRLHGDNGRAKTAHEVVAQMLAAEAVASAHAEVVAMAVPIARRNGGKGLDAVGRLPAPVGLLDGIVSHKTAQYRPIGLLVILKILVLLPQKLLGRLVFGQLRRSLLHRLHGKFSAAAAGSRQGQNVNPGKGFLLPLSADVDGQRRLHGLIAHIKIHPFNIVLLGKALPRTQDQQQNTAKQLSFHQIHLQGSM